MVEFLYILTIFLFMIHMGIIDAQIYSNDEIYGFLKSDIIYLGGTFILLLLITILAHIYVGSAFILVTLGSIFLGSIGWDIIFGILRYNDAFYPYKKWFYNFGFANKRQRIIFDISRLVIGIILIII